MYTAGIYIDKTRNPGLDTNAIAQEFNFSWYGYHHVKACHSYMAESYCYLSLIYSLIAFSEELKKYNCECVDYQVWDSNKDTYSIDSLVEDPYGITR